MGGGAVHSQQKVIEVGLSQELLAVDEDRGSRGVDLNAKAVESLGLEEIPDGMETACEDVAAPGVGEGVVGGGGRGGDVDIGEMAAKKGGRIVVAGGGVVELKEANEGGPGCGGQSLVLVLFARRARTFGLLGDLEKGWSAMLHDRTIKETAKTRLETRSFLLTELLPKSF